MQRDPKAICYWGTTTLLNNIITQIKDGNRSDWILVELKAEPS